MAFLEEKMSYRKKIENIQHLQTIMSKIIKISLLGNKVSNIHKTTAIVHSFKLQEKIIFALLPL